MYTMRSAFKRWLILHNEGYRAQGYIKVPYWFRYYIRNNKEWKYIVTNIQDDYYCNKRELDYNSRRRYKGHYVFDISDLELLALNRPERL